MSVAKEDKEARTNVPICAGIVKRRVATFWDYGCGDDFQRGDIVLLTRCGDKIVKILYLVCAGKVNYVIYLVFRELRHRCNFVCLDLKILVLSLAENNCRAPETQPLIKS
jgi:hypothetical protein